MRPRTGGRGRIRVGRSGDAAASDWQTEAGADNLDENDYGGDYDEAEMLKNIIEKVHLRFSSDSSVGGAENHLI